MQTTHHIEWRPDCLQGLQPCEVLLRECRQIPVPKGLLYLAQLLNKVLKPILKTLITCE